MKTAALWFGLLVALCAGCGQTPVRIVIDEFSMELNLTDTMQRATRRLAVVPEDARALPELWPASLAEIELNSVVSSGAVPVDLSPDPDAPNAGKYRALSELGDSIRRIELNRMVLRVDQSDLTVALPELQVQVAASPDAATADRFAWHTIGTIPGAPPGFVGDLELAFVPGGESFLHAQLSDSDRDFAVRVRGRAQLHLKEGTRIPRGRASLRLVVVATFFVDAGAAVDAVQTHTGT